MQAQISQNGARLAAPGHQILAKIANGTQRAEKMDANSRLPGADIQRHKVVLIGILSRQCLTPEISLLGRHFRKAITYGCIGQALFHVREAFFNVAMMFASRLFHTGPSICKKPPQTSGSTSTSGGFLVGALNAGDDKMSEMNFQQLPSMKPVSLGGAAIVDAGAVRFGGHAPALPAVRVSAAAVADAGRVRFGGHAPSLPQVRVSAEAVADAGRVRFSGHAPSLPQVRISAEAVADAGRVRFGGHAPSLPQVRVSAEAVADAGRVRFGGHAPSLPQVRISAEAVADAGKVRFGGHAPSLPQVRVSASAATNAGKVRVGGCAPSLPR
jgi:hypothetical protein